MKNLASKTEPNNRNRLYFNKKLGVIHGLCEYFFVITIKGTARH